MRCLLLSPDFRQFHLVKQFPYRSSFPPLYFTGYQGTRNSARAKEAVKRFSAGSLFKPGSSGNLAELNHGSQSATGRKRPTKVTKCKFCVLKWLQDGPKMSSKVHACVCVGQFAMWSRCRTRRFISGSSCTLRRKFLYWLSDWLSVPSSNLVMLNWHLRLPVFYSQQ